MPKIYIMQGVAGSGKSTKSRAIVNNTANCVKLTFDEIAFSLFSNIKIAAGQEHYTEQQKFLVSSVIGAAAKTALLNGFDVVIDNISGQEHVDFWTNFAQDNRAELEVIHCTKGEEAIKIGLRNRMESSITGLQFLYPDLFISTSPAGNSEN